MRKIFYLIAMAIAAVAFTACSDEDSILADVVIPEETNLMQLERYSYSLPFEIKSDSEWEIKFGFDDGEICYALPDHGTGSQTVKLCVIDNPLEKRRVGEMHIIFPKDESKNLVIQIQQKSIAEYDENDPVKMEKGNQIYVIGYGYNTLGARASMESVSLVPIIAIEKAHEKGRMVIDNVDATYNVSTYTGSSVSELSNQLSANAKFGGKYLGFKGEVGAAFDMKDFSKQENEYAISYVEVEKQTARMSMNVDEIINSFMLVSAREAINGLPSINEFTGRKRESSFSSTPEGLAKLVQTYGTHLVMSTKLGGCLKYVTTVDISKVEGSYDLKAFANCSYENSFVNLNANVSDSLHKSYTANSKAIHTTLRVQGGDGTAADNLVKGGTGKDNPNYDAWIESLNDVSNQTLVRLDNTTLIPLYELVDRSLTEDEDGVDGEKRYAALKAYINGDQIESDMSKALDMEYVMGDATHLPTIPDFSAESGNQDQSLIKDYHRGGQAVARICHEYIPVIDKFQRVCVVYPIISNKVKYNMGYFVGDATHRPAKVCWSSDGLSVNSLTDQPMGRATELWVRGSNFFRNPDDSTIVNAFETVDATVQPYTVRAPGYDGKNIDYPLVKIFNQK